jgi:hypothetical protein
MQFLGMPDFMTDPFSFLSGFSLVFIKPAILVFFVFVICTISVILSFHWRKYGMGEKVFKLVEAIFVAVSILLVIFAWLNL